MARIRTIKPEFFRHQELYLIEKKTKLPLRVAYAGLFTVADREGRFRWKPTEIKLDVLPFDNVDMENVLNVLDQFGFIEKYSVDGKDYACIPSFKDHQVINNREAHSKIPPNPRVTVITVTPVVTRHDPAQGEGKGREGKTYTRVTETLCKVFAKDYKLPDDRMSAEANFYKDIDNQAELLLQVFTPEILIDQVNAYLKHCKATDRKLIGNAYKLSETITSCDWVKLNNPESSKPPDNPFAEAEYNRTLWKEDAWKATYAHQINTNPAFKTHFQV